MYLENEIQNHTSREKEEINTCSLKNRNDFINKYLNIQIIYFQLINFKYI